MENQNEKIKKIKSAIAGLSKVELDKLTASFREGAAPVKTAIEDLEQTAQKEIFNESKKERRKNFILLATGAIFGGALTLVWYFFRDEIASKYQYITAIWVIVLLVVALILGIVLFFKNTLLYKIFGVGKASYEAIIGTLATPLKNIIKGTTKTETYEQIAPSLQVVENSTRQLVAYLAYRRTRTWLFGLFFSLTIGLFGFLGTFLLVRQNELIKEQSYLSEAARRSSLVFMMSNIMDKVDEELRREGVSDEPYHESRKLSDVTIGRIAALSQGMKPIKYLENGKLTDEAYSPERGQLLLSLVNSKLDTIETYRKVFEGTLFDEIELRNAKLDNSFLSKINIKNANLAGINLQNTIANKIIISESNLNNADLKGVLMPESNFKGTDLSYAIMSDTNLKDSDFGNCNLSYAKMFKSNLAGSNFVGANLKEARLDRANLTGSFFSIDLAYGFHKTYKDLKAYSGIFSPIFNDNFEEVTGFTEKDFSTNLNNVSFSGACLDSTFFHNVNFGSTPNFHGTQLKNSIIINSNLENALFFSKEDGYIFGRRKPKVKIVETKNLSFPKEFKGPNMDGSLIVYSNLKKSYYENCSIKMAKFCFSDLSESYFEKCNLFGTDFRGVNLTKAKFSETILDNVIVESPKWIKELELYQVEGRKYIADIYKLEEVKNQTETYYILKRKTKTHE